MITQPIAMVAAFCPAARAELMRVILPGKATAPPITKPAAPASVIANSSVTPWIISQPVNS